MEKSICGDPHAANESLGQPLLPFPLFLRRILIHGGTAFVLATVSLTVGAAGYALTEHMGWIDALLNASMILAGMGPAAELRTDAGKLFASAYALYSGILFIATAGLLLAPFAHRLMHRLHVDDDG